MRQPWKLMMVNLTNNGVLKLVYVYEIHLFVIFGFTFRKELVNLKDSFFSIFGKQE